MAMWAEESEQERLQYELEEDLRTERELALKHLSGELDCPWPWYAAEPCAEIEPQVFGP